MLNLDQHKILLDLLLSIKKQDASVTQRPYDLRVLIIITVNLIINIPTNDAK